MTSGPIIVGIDGSPDGQRALDWALTWSRAVAVPLSMVAAEPIPPGRKPDAPGIGDRAKAVVEAEQERLRASSPDVAVDGRAEIAHPVTALVNASQSAGAVVVGTKGTGGWRGTILGSVSGNTAASSYSPTVILPPTAPSAFDPSGPLVVGFDGSDASVATARLAIEAAASEGRSVRLVQADAGGSAPEEPLDEVVDGLRAAQPGVEVQLVTVEGRAVEVLTEHSAGAAFVIVASQGHRGVPGFLLGSTTRELVQTSQAPVIVLTGRSKRLWPVGATAPDAS